MSTHTGTGAAPVDAFTIEIIKDALVAVGDEMFVSLQRTSMSPIIYEVLDYCCGILDRDSGLVAQGNGVAGFLGTITFAAKSVIDKFGYAGLKEGDIIVTNDPYSGGGTHLSDVSLVMPIFFEGEVVGFAANKAHWTEVGGKDPGSWTTDATEVFQEGLQFPCIKIFIEGQPIQGLLDLIAANVRTPEMTIGDIWAQVASVRLGALRFQQLCAKYGVGTIQSAIDALMDHGERTIQQELLKLPKGVFFAEDWIDDDGLTDEPHHCQVVVTVTDDEFVCDFTGSAPMAKGPINCTRTGLEAAARLVFKAITDPHIPANEGTFRALRVICPDATVLTAVRPAPVSTYWETMIFGADLIWKALAPSVPDRLSAGHYLSVSADVTFTIHPDTGKPAILVEPNAGGWGAGIDQDGESGMFCVGNGVTYNIPLEVAEAAYGIQVDQFAFNTAPGGEGKYSGGRGVIRDYRILSDQGGFITATLGRHKFKPWAVDGAQQGSGNSVVIIHADGRPDVVRGKTARYPLKKGDVARLMTGSGGGWGDPKERDHAQVLADVRGGIVSRETARDIYGLSDEELASV